MRCQATLQTKCSQYVSGMNKPETHAQIVKLWPSFAEFAKDIGVKRDAGRMMFTRNSIPSWRFDAVIEALLRRGFPPLTYAELSAMAKAKEN